jgi:N-acyl-D-amino-acid deacylase
VLKAGITWDWETFPEYLDAAQRRKPALNLAFLAPLTPLRHYVMGEASMERAASEDETKRIQALLGEALDAGAFGFSSTLLNQHMGYGGRPLACRNASREELKAYCNALKARGKGAIEIAMTKQFGVMDDRSSSSSTSCSRKAAARSPSSPCSTATTSPRRCANRSGRPRQ